MARKSVRREAGAEIRFEEAMARLEAIVRELEGGDIPLEKSLELFEEGVRLSKVCHARLSEAEKKVQVLVRSASGGLEAAPFETDEEEAGDEGDEDEDDGGGTSLF